MAVNYASWRSFATALVAAHTRSVMTQQVETVVAIEGNGPVFGLLVAGMPTTEYTRKAEVRALNGWAA